jgi:hypothetical protein
VEFAEQRGELHVGANMARLRQGNES